MSSDIKKNECYPDDLLYTHSHEWVRVLDSGIAEIGITQYAHESLGELVYVELPGLNMHLSKAQACVIVESTKAASDVYSPLEGTVMEINESLKESPQIVNQSPYVSGWLFRLQIAHMEQLSDLLSAHAYFLAIKS